MLKLRFLPTVAAMAIVLLLSACGGGSNVYMLPEGEDFSLRIVRGANPNDVLASSEKKGYIEMAVGQTLDISAYYRFRSAVADKQKDELVSTTSAYQWLEPLNDKVSYANGRITALQPGLDTLRVTYVDNNAGQTLSCRLEVTVK